MLTIDWIPNPGMIPGFRPRCRIGDTVYLASGLPKMAQERRKIDRECRLLDFALRHSKGQSVPFKQLSDGSYYMAMD